MYFYIQDGGILPNRIGWQILSHRLRFLPGNPQGVVSHAFFAGATCQDYYGVPYGGLGVANGVQLEGTSRGTPIFNNILSAGGGQNWGPPATGTVHTRRVMLPAVNGGTPYLRSVITLSDVVNCPGVTHVDWIACREHW